MCVLGTCGTGHVAFEGVYWVHVAQVTWRVGVCPGLMRLKIRPCGGFLRALK